MIYGSPTGLSATYHPDQLWSKQTTNVEGDIRLCDFFGFAVTAGDFNGDGYDDLAIGSPSHSFDCTTKTYPPSGGDGSSVHVIYGSSSGLSPSLAHPDQIFLSSGAQESGLGFGSSLNTGDFNGDSFPDLAIGFEGETLGASEEEAGGIFIVFGSISGLSSHRRRSRPWR